MNQTKDMYELEVVLNLFAFSRLGWRGGILIEGLKEEAIEVSNFAVAREIARLRWIENNCSLPLWLREKAGKTVQDLLHLESNFVIREWEKNYDLHQLSNICFEFFLKLN